MTLDNMCLCVCLRAPIPGQVFSSVSSLPQKDIKTASWYGHLAVVAPLFSTVVILHGEFLACTVAPKCCWPQC